MLTPLKYISSITFNTRISHKLINKVNEMIWRLCLENGSHYIETRNVNENELSKDGLHLQSSNKKKIVSSFHCKVTNVRHFFRKTNMIPQYRSARGSGVASATRQ